MANIAHQSIPEAYLHEPKGVSTATDGQIYIANGLGSGVWTTYYRFGELFISSGATAQTLSAASAYARLDPGTAWQSGVNNGVTMTPTDGTMTILATGTYHLAFWVVFSTASLASGTRYNFKYAVNGVPNVRTLSTGKTTNGVDTLDAASTGIATLTAGDVVSIYVGGDATSSSTNITVLEAGFSLHKA
jgi:hypothetical protein